MLFLVSVVENDQTLGVVVIAAKDRNDLAHKIATIVPLKMESEVVDISLLIDVTSDEMKHMTINQWYDAEDAQRMGFKTFGQYVAENN